ncbi:MAG: NTP transferase domain-containing protein [Candidatus Binataceae bacterium]
MPDILSGAIIAAGRGERLRSATAGLPKPLVELDGKALLLRQIELMQRIGLKSVYVIVNTETAGLLQQRGIAIPAGVELVVADTPTSMESILTLGTRIPPGWFLLTTVDAIVTESEFRRFAAQARSLIAASAGAGPFDGALGVVKWRGDARPLFVDSAADGLITRLGDEQSERVTAGLYFFTTRIFAYADEARALRLNALRRFLAFLLGKKMRFAAIELTVAVDVDEAADLEQARALITGRRENGASG